MSDLRRSCASMMLTAIAVVGLPLLVPSTGWAQQQQLVVGADFGANPSIIANPDGSVSGFNVDLVNEVAKRMGRPGVKFVDQQFSGIFAGLEAKKYESIASPLTLTQQRSEAMLFIEGFVATDLQFLTRKDGLKIESLDALKG